MNEAVENNAAHYFVDRHLSTGTGAKNAFIEVAGHKRSITYEGLSSQSAKMAGLLGDHDIRREERIAVLVLDQIEFPIIFFGAMKAGVVPVAINTLLSTDLYDVILRDSRASALFVSKELLEVVEPALANCPDIRSVFVIGDHVEDPYLDFSKELASGAQKETIAVKPDEQAFWLYSSGSTGQPKGVRHVHSSMRYTAETYGSDILGIRSDDLVYSAAKFFFAYGLGNSVSFPMSVGATTLLFNGRPTPDGVLDILTEHKPTIFCGVPTLYAAMVAYAEANSVNFDRELRRCLSAGEALPADVGNGWERLSGCEILDGVGSTEMLHIFLSNAPGDVEYGTSGVAVPGYELRLVDESGAEVKTGEIGEMLVNGESSAADYWNQRDKSRSTFEGAWTRTGDKYERREDGRYIYCGRTDDMFKVSGIWVSPFEVEQALIAHASVLEAAVVPARDDSDLEKPKAFVVLKSRTSDDDLIADLKSHVQQQIGKWKYPRWIEFVDELPKTATGKIQRFKLRS